MEEKKRGKKRAERVSWNCLSGLDVEDRNKTNGRVSKCHSYCPHFQPQASRFHGVQSSVNHVIWIHFLNCIFSSAISMNSDLTLLNNRELSKVLGRAE